MNNNDKLALLYKCKSSYEPNCYVASGDTININGTLNVVSVLDSYHIKFDKFCNGMCLHTHQFSNLEGLDSYFIPNYRFHNLIRVTFNQMRNLVFQKFEIRLGRIEESQEEKELVLKELSDKILGVEPSDSCLETIKQIGLESFIVKYLLGCLKEKFEDFTIEQLREGYRIITGLSDEEMTDEGIYNYMLEIWLEEEEEDMVYD